MINLPKIQDVDLNGKIVLVRVDHNVVKKGEIHDPYRIDSTFNTLFHIYANGGKAILMSHVGRPKDKKTGEITISKDTSVKPIVDYLREKLSLRIEIPEFAETEGKGYLNIGKSINPLLDKLQGNDLDAIYLPNTRWFYGEQAKDNAADDLAEQLAQLADIYVNDAFGSWRPHASTARITKYLPPYAGLLMKKEIKNLDQIYNPKKPFVAVVAGSKFDTKVASLSSLLERADYLILGGVIYNVYLAAKYGFEIKGVSEEEIESAQKFMKSAEKYKEKIIELPYIVESDEIEGKKENKYRTHDIRKLDKTTTLNFVLDADPKSFEDEKVSNIFNEAETIFVNAVMGLTPHFNEGTKAMIKAIVKNKNGRKLFGGGDTLQEFKRLEPGDYLKAVDDDKFYLFTGGGAVLKAIEGDDPLIIPPVKALIENAKK